MVLALTGPSSTQAMNLQLRLGQTQPAPTQTPELDAGPGARGTLWLRLAKMDQPQARRELDLKLPPATSQGGEGDAGTDTGQGRDPNRIVLTLDEAIRHALKHSRNAISARLSREEQGFALLEAEDRYRPKAQIGVSGNAAKDTEATAQMQIGPTLRIASGGALRLSWSTPIGGTADTGPTTTLGFSQPLLKGFGPNIDTVALRKARMQEEINVRGFRDEMAGVVDAVTGAYRSMLHGERGLAIARSAVERAHEQMRINRALVDAGRMPRQDLVQSEADVASNEYALIDAQTGLEEAHAQLVNILDLPEQTGLELAQEPTPTPMTLQFDASLEKAFAERADYLQALHEVAQAEMDLEVARNNQLWDLSLNATLTRQRNLTDYGAGVTLSIPIGDRSSKHGLARARNTVKRARMKLAETRQSIAIEVRQALQGVSVRLRQIALARKGRELAEKKMQIERKKLQAGLSSVFHIGRFEDDLVAAQNREIEAISGYRTAVSALHRVLAATLSAHGIRIDEVAP